ncbi:MAG: rRNA maturation RNase YbeY [Eggerthellaceae bacterium]|nr:rRNA maturation RNase YbeY [Eggerthellaceae bacterium]
MEVLLDISYGEDRVDDERVLELAAFAALKLDVPEPSEVSVCFIDDDAMADLNEGFRGKVGPTDVLSFECDNLDDEFPHGEAFQLGDVIIAVDVAARQAEELGHSLADEVDTLLVHGILHLLGYDHMEEAEAQEMEGLQDSILHDWNESRKGGEDVL